MPWWLLCFMGSQEKAGNIKIIGYRWFTDRYPLLSTWCSHWRRVRDKGSYILRQNKLLTSLLSVFQLE